MALDYYEVLKDLEYNVVVIGRGEESAKNFKKKTGVDVQIGGLEIFLESNPNIPSHVIIAVNVEYLYVTTKLLLKFGVENLLVEKPGALYQSQFNELKKLIKEVKANVLIAYNRRFYASVIKARELINSSGGVISFTFEFTERTKLIETIDLPKEVKENWFFGNSTHVIDLAFYLGGFPNEIKTFTRGSLPWHPTGSVFSGAGVTDSEALFSYHANWESAGRWGIEILTKNNRLVLRPLEKLQLYDNDNLHVYEDIDYTLDEMYKPGLFLQTQAFLSCDFSNFVTMLEQASHKTLYSKICPSK